MFTPYNEDVLLGLRTHYSKTPSHKSIFSALKNVACHTIMKHRRHIYLHVFDILANRISKKTEVKFGKIQYYTSSHGSISSGNETFIFFSNDISNLYLRYFASDGDSVVFGHETDEHIIFHLCFMKNIKDFQKLE